MWSLAARREMTSITRVIPETTYYSVITAWGEDMALALDFFAEGDTTYDDVQKNELYKVLLDAVILAVYTQ